MVIETAVFTYHVDYEIFKPGGVSAPIPALTTSDLRRIEMAIKPICSIPDCDKTSRAMGWCSAHYQRWRKYGTPTPANGGTQWGTPLRYLNEVVLAYDGDECLLWPFGKGGGGYGCVRVDGKDQLVSRIVCASFRGPAPTPEHEVAHRCGGGDEGCVTRKHLRWATHTENMADQLIHGTRNRGARHGLAKLNEDAVRAIRPLLGTMSNGAIGRKFGVSAGAIWQLSRGKSWWWVQ